MKNLTDYEATKLSKILAVVYGVILMAGAFLVKYAGTMVLQLAYTIAGILGGPLLGIFFLGMMIPRANYKVNKTGIKFERQDVSS